MIDTDNPPSKACLREANRWPLHFQAAAPGGSLTPPEDAGFGTNIVSTGNLGNFFPNCSSGIHL